MAIISSFLCWSNTRTGSAVCGYYTLVISVVCLAFYMLRYIALDEMNDSIELKGIVYAGFVLYSFLIGVSLILLPGVYMDRKFLLLPWIYVLVITVLYETGAIALITTVHLEEDHTLDAWEIVAVAFYCLRLIANCYCFACVVSQYQELSEGRGTYEFLFKPRRRHMARGAPLSDLDEYNPPYGATLPPYSEDNPYKEYSPPNYENLSINYNDIDDIYNTPRSREQGRHRNGGSTSYLADVIVNPPPAGYDNDSIADSDNDQSYSYSESHFQHSYSASDTSACTIELTNGRLVNNPEFSNPRFSSDTYEQHHQHLGNNQHNGHHHTPSDSSSSIAMTSSSAHLMDYMANGNSSSHRPQSHSHKHHKPSRPPKRVPVSPLTIQKRTYITWI